MTYPTVYAPGPYKRYEIEFVNFVMAQGWPAGHNDTIPSELRRQLHGVRGDLRSNDPDTYFLPPFAPVVYADVKAHSANHPTAPDVCIEIKSLANYVHQTVPTIIVLEPDWDWIAAPDALLRIRLGCCRVHLEMAQRDEYARLPVSCPNRNDRFVPREMRFGTDDPYIKIARRLFRPWAQIARLMEWAAPDHELATADAEPDLTLSL